MLLSLTRREEFEYLMERSGRFYETALLQIDRGFISREYTLEEAEKLRKVVEEVMKVVGRAADQGS